MMIPEDSPVLTGQYSMWGNPRPAPWRDSASAAQWPSLSTTTFTPGSRLVTNSSTGKPLSPGSMAHRATRPS